MKSFTLAIFLWKALQKQTGALVGQSGAAAALFSLLIKEVLVEICRNKNRKLKRVAIK
jgi:hypothetical protein